MGETPRSNTGTDTTPRRPLLGLLYRVTVGMLSSDGTDEAVGLHKRRPCLLSRIHWRAEHVDPVSRQRL
jgi:hypothetical protein